MTKKKRSSHQRSPQDLLERPWTPFVRCRPDPHDPETSIFQNSRYQVHLSRLQAHDGGPDLVHLSFKRLDHGIFIPYRDKMRLKDELVGSECEGVELFPARSRELDSANQFHLWVIDETGFRFPFGFNERLVTEASIGGSVQHPWPKGERPADCLSEEQMQARMATYLSQKKEM